jgi:hypothetical protein
MKFTKIKSQLQNRKNSIIERDSFVQLANKVSKLYTPLDTVKDEEGNSTQTLQ